MKQIAVDASLSGALALAATAAVFALIAGTAPTEAENIAAALEQSGQICVSRNENAGPAN